jgi:hypothetical protein
MATPLAIAQRASSAVKRIDDASAKIGLALGTEAVDTNPRHKQSDIAQVLRLEAIAGLLEKILAALPAPAVEARRPSAKAKNP